MPQPLEFLRKATVQDSVVTLLNAIDRSLSLEYYGGNVNVVQKAFTTGWRTLPFAMISQNPYGLNRLETDDESIDVGDNRACCLCPGVHHRCTTLSKDSLTRWVHVRFIVFGGIDLFTLIRPPLWIGGKTGWRIGDINEQLVKLAKGDQPPFETLLRRKLLCTELLLAIFEGQSVTDDLLRTTQAHRLLPALDYIHTHTQETISLQRLSKLVHLSPSRFSAVFTACMGKPPREYILQQRMQKSQELLLTTSLNLNDIAEAIGYASQFHFSRVFKGTFGTSPSKYRRQSKEQGWGAHKVDPRAQ
jgi:AraC-like DNA-binding protein